MKFKVGDQVKILPRATHVAVREEEVGKIGIIKDVRFGNGSLHVRMLNPCKGKIHVWSVSSNMITPVTKIGQQLLFAFMR